MLKSLILLILSVSIPLLAQNCSFQLDGEIIDGETNEKLAGAIIQIKSEGATIETDSNGYYNFNNLCNDSITIEVTFSGYKNYKKNIRIKPKFHFDILLHTEGSELASVEITHKKDDYKTLTSTTISERGLDKQRGKNLGEILKTLPGVDAIQTGPNVFKPTIQGFSGNRIVIIQNNVRLEGQNWGNDHAPEIDPFSTDQITVIKGANALVYGPEAQSGAIIIAPFKVPKKSGIYGNTFSNLQTNNRMFQNAGQVCLSSHKFKNWYTHIQGSQKYGGNIKTPEHYLDNTASQEFNGSAHIGYDGVKRNFRLTYNSFNQTLGVYKGANIGNLSDLIKNLEGLGYENTNKFSYDINRSYQHTKHNLLQLKYQQNFKKGSSLTSILTYQHNDRKEFDLHRPKSDHSNKPNISYLLSTWQAELQYNHRVIKNNIRKSGIQAFQQENITETTDLRLFIPNFKSKSLGVYHIHSLIFAKTQMDLGVRYDLRQIQIYKYVNKELISPSKTYHAFSSSMGINHQINRHIDINLNIAYSMRPPAVNELFSDGLHHGESIFIMNNKTDFSFKTENNLNNTISLNFRKPNINTQLSGFYNRIQNFIYLKPSAPIISIRGAFPTFYYQQSNATVLGLDFLNHINLSKKWALETKGNITQGKEQFDGDYILNMPSPKLSNAMSYSFKNYKILKNSELELSYMYCFKQVFFPKKQFDINYNTVEGPKTFTLIGDYLPAPNGYGLLNASFNTEIPFKKIKVNFYISANNLLNTRYRNYLNRLRYYTDEQGFNCSTTVKVTF